MNLVDAKARRGYVSKPGAPFEEPRVIRSTLSIARTTLAMPAAMFAAAHLAPAAAHRQSAHGVTRAAASRPPARARPPVLARRPRFGEGSRVVEVRRRRGGCGGHRAGRRAHRALRDVREEDHRRAQRALGEEDAEEEERRREEEADLSRRGAIALEAAKAAEERAPLKTTPPRPPRRCVRSSCRCCSWTCPSSPVHARRVFPAGKDAQTTSTNVRRRLLFSYGQMTAESGRANAARPTESPWCPRPWTPRRARRSSSART